MNTAEVQQTLAFAAMCVDATAKAEGCSRREMYRRLRDVGLMHGLTTRLDPLHTQSKEYVQNSRTCDLLHDERSLLYLMSDGYIVDDVVRELQFSTPAAW